MGLISRQKLEKRTEKNGMFLLKNRKEWNLPNGKERGAQPWGIMYPPTSSKSYSYKNYDILFC